MNAFLKFTPKPVGTLSKSDAIDYVGSPDFFTDLEKRFGLCPCRVKGTSIRYRIQELDRCLEAAEVECKNERAAR
jgi:hypothetical protein